MREAVDLHHGDVVVAEQDEHPLDEAGHEQRHVAAGGVGRLHRRGSAASPARSPSSGPFASRSSRATITSCGSAGRTWSRAATADDR
jgi:hypothetical protein